MSTTVYVTGYQIKEAQEEKLDNNGNQNILATESCSLKLFGGAFNFICILLQIYVENLSCQDFWTLSQPKISVCWWLPSAQPRFTRAPGLGDGAGSYVRNVQIIRAEGGWCCGLTGADVTWTVLIQIILQLSDLSPIPHQTISCAATQTQYFGPHTSIPPASWNLKHRLIFKMRLREQSFSFCSLDSHFDENILLETWTPSLTKWDWKVGVIRCVCSAPSLLITAWPAAAACVPVSGYHYHPDASQLSSCSLRLRKLSGACELSHVQDLKLAAITGLLCLLMGRMHYNGVMEWPSPSPGWLWWSGKMKEQGAVISLNPRLHILTLGLALEFPQQDIGCKMVTGIY